MYKPNFCSECGARIERSRWRLWTSRQYCSDCEPGHRNAQLRLLLVSGAIFFTLGLIIGRAARPAPPPLIVERGELPSVALHSDKGGARPTSGPESQANTVSPANAEPAYGPDGTSTERPTDPAETISICGARTQKGTPCQRRVRGTGRCWQHKGLPAMLPPAKLVVQE